MQINSNRYLSRPKILGDKLITERGDLIVWFRDRLNEANRKDGHDEVTAARVAKNLQGIQTHDLGRDLYFIKGKMEEALETGFPVGAVYYGTIRRLKDVRRRANEKLC